MDIALKKVRSNNGKKRRKKITFDIDDNGCFNITSHVKGKKGYSNITRNGRRTTMHRYIYEECFGLIPYGFVVRHKCDNPSCINPEHLEVGTHQDNSNDCDERGRRPNGESVYGARLTGKDVKKIKRILMSNKVDKQIISEIAKHYEVNINTIYAIHYNKSWVHINA